MDAGRGDVDRSDADQGFQVHRDAALSQNRRVSQNKETVLKSPVNMRDLRHDQRSLAVI